MSMEPIEADSGAAVLGRLIQPGRGDFAPEAARAILKIEFDARDRARMHALAVKAQDGTLTAREQAEIEEYRQAGYLLGLLWSKARLSLKQAGKDARDGIDT
jgi:hypothetical protein